MHELVPILKLYPVNRMQSPDHQYANGSRQPCSGEKVKRDAKVGSSNSY